jgi:hypothetical protein
MKPFGLGIKTATIVEVSEDFETALRRTHKENSVSENDRSNDLDWLREEPIVIRTPFLMPRT